MMGYDLKIHQSERAEADGLEIWFSEESVTCSGMTRLRHAMHGSVDLMLFQFNDWQVIDPEKCVTIADRMDSLLKDGDELVSERPDFFSDWSKFCRIAARYGGFEVG